MRPLSLIFSNQMDYDVLVRTANDRQQQNVFSSVIGNTGQVEEVTLILLIKLLIIITP